MADLRLVAPAPTVPDRLDALKRAIPESGEVAMGAEAEAIGVLGEVKLRIAALESALVARVLSPASAPGSARKDGEDRLVGAREAARILGVSTDYVYTHSRELPSVRLGRRLLFRRAALTHPGYDRDTIRRRRGQ